MKWSTFAIASALLLALFVFGQRRTPESPNAVVAGVVDLTHTISQRDPNWEGSTRSPYEAKQLTTIEHDGYFTRSITLPEHFATHVDAPAHFMHGAWTVDEIPVDRLIAPLVIVDVQKNVAKGPDYQVGVDDLAAWEQANGPVPAGAVVLARTGWATRWYNARDYRNADTKGVMHFPGFSLDAVKFLVDARQVVGVGIDTLSVDPGRSQDFPVHHFTAAHQVYHLENVSNLDQVPEAGATAVIAPAKLEGGSGGPVRVLALLK